MNWFVALILSAVSFATFANDKVCEYNEWNGKMLLHYVAHEPKEARGWAPTALVLCKDDQGLYSIVTHRAIGLGELANPPLRIPAKIEEAKKGDKRFSWLFNEGSSFDEREAGKLLDNDAFEAVIVVTGVKKQITVIRKELRAVVSNTLFLKDEAAKEELSEWLKIESKE